MVVTSMEYQAIWLYKMLSEFKHEEKNPIKILCSNNSIIALTRNLMAHDIRKSSLSFVD